METNSRLPNGFVAPRGSLTCMIYHVDSHNIIPLQEIPPAWAQDACMWGECVEQTAILEHLRREIVVTRAEQRREEQSALMPALIRLSTLHQDISTLKAASDAQREREACGIREAGAS